MLSPLRYFIFFRLTYEISSLAAYLTWLLHSPPFSLPPSVFISFCQCLKCPELNVDITRFRKIQWQYHFPVSGNSSSMNVAQGFIIFLENIVDEYWSFHQLKSLNLFSCKLLISEVFSILYFCRIIKTKQNKRKKPKTRWQSHIQVLLGARNWTLLYLGKSNINCLDVSMIFQLAFRFK